jgi:polysaccharide export outer membrane protein
MIKKIKKSVLILPICWLVSSCVTTEKVTYFNNATDTTIYKSQELADNVIQKKDILSISISSLNADASAIFNTANNFAISTSTSTGMYAHSSGYLVDANGYIQIPIIGTVLAEGHTKKQLKEDITRAIVEKKLLVDPIVNIRHLNYEVTVLGEVKNPTVINVPNEKMPLLKALGLAGDITVYGKKDNVLLIRETDSKKEMKYLNLNSKDFINSPYYNLMPNDIVYVQSNKNKVASVGRGTQLLPVMLSALSVLVIVFSKF